MCFSTINFSFPEELRYIARSSLVRDISFSSSCLQLVEIKKWNIIISGQDGLNRRTKQEQKQSKLWLCFARRRKTKSMPTCSPSPSCGEGAKRTMTYWIQTKEKSGTVGWWYERKVLYLWSNSVICYKNIP